MRFHWNTTDVVADIQKIEGVDKVGVQPPGGDVDSDNLVVYVGDEILLVSAFCYEDYEVDPHDYMFDAVEVTDQSGQGLESNEEIMALVYVRVRKYFDNRDVEIVRCMKDYF